MEVPPPEAPFFINNQFNPSWFEAWSRVLTLQECDNRYFKRSGGVISGSATINSDLTVLGNMIGPVNVTGNINITGSYLVNSVPILSQATADARYVQLTGSTMSGDLKTTAIGIGNNLVTTLTRDLTILESSATPEIQIGRSNTNGNSFIIGYTHVGDNNVLNRIFIQPMGASTNDTITFTVNGGRVGLGSTTPTQKLEVMGNININSGSSYMIGGTSIDSRYLRSDVDTTNIGGLRLYSNAASGGTQTILRMGHTVASGDWYWRHYRDAVAANNTLEMLNTNSNLIGFSYGTGNGTSDGDGCLLVMNGIQGTSGWIAANQAAANGALHLNCGIPQAVPANRRYGPSTSDPSNQSGGTVSISLYAYNDVWIRGSMYATSDRRMKRNIKKWNIGESCMDLLNVDAVWYHWKNESENALPNLGFIAQDLLRYKGCQDLVQLFKNEECKEKCDETNTDAGFQYVVSYDKIPLYNLEIIKIQQERINKLETLVNQLIDLLPKTKKASFQS